MPQQSGDSVRGLDAALPIALPTDAGGTIWTAPVGDAAKPAPDAGAPVADDAGSDSRGHGKPRRDAGDALRDAMVEHDAATPDDAMVEPPPIDAGRCGGMCPADRPHCLEDATCAQCALDSDCDPATPRCEPSTHSCVPCLEAGDCGGDTPACDVATHSCVRCVSDSDCDEGSPLCNPANHTCVGCLSDANCGGDLAHCDLNAQRCVACLEDGHCTDPARAHCQAGACQACTENAQCAHLPITHICGVAGDSDGKRNAGHCIECATHTDCADLARPECDHNQCGPCTGDDACADRPNASVCDDGKQRRGRRRGERGSGACIECDADHEDACGDRVCDTQQKRCSDRERASARLCAPCLGDGECTGDYVCASDESNATGAASYCVVENNADACLQSCAAGLPLVCAFGF